MAELLKFGDNLDGKETLYRRSYNNPKVKFLNTDNTPTSRVFEPRDKDNGKLSTLLKRLTTPIDAIQDTKKYYLFEIGVDAVHEIGLTAIFSPSDSNPAHSSILGMDKHTRYLAGDLARKAKFVKV